MTRCMQKQEEEEEEEGKEGKDDLSGGNIQLPLIPMRGVTCAGLPRRRRDRGPRRQCML